MLELLEDLLHYAIFYLEEYFSVLLTVTLAIVFVSVLLSAIIATPIESTRWALPGDVSHSPLPSLLILLHIAYRHHPCSLPHTFVHLLMVSLFAVLRPPLHKGGDLKGVWERGREGIRGGVVN